MATAMRSVARTTSAVGVRRIRAYTLPAKTLRRECQRNLGLIGSVMSFIRRTVQCGCGSANRSEPHRLEIENSKGKSRHARRYEGAIGWMEPHVWFTAPAGGARAIIQASGPALPRPHLFRLD